MSSPGAPAQSQQVSTEGGNKPASLPSAQLVEATSQAQNPAPINPSSPLSLPTNSDSVSRPQPPAVEGTKVSAQRTCEAKVMSSDVRNAQNAVSPSLGSRIEVLWRIDYEHDEADKMDVDTSIEGSQTVTRWWGATIQDCLKETVGSKCPQHSEKRLYVLLYDAYQEFAEDTATVAFISDDTLIDMAQLDDANKGELQWRVENTGDKQAGPNSDIAQLVSLEQYAAEVSAAVEGAGLSEEADLQVLSTLPPHVQAQVASGYRRFADHVKSSLATFMQEKPKDYIVTKADVQSMFASMQSKPT